MFIENIILIELNKNVKQMYFNNFITVRINIFILLFKLVENLIFILCDWIILEIVILTLGL
jgi:hypothetical protein